LRSDGNPLWPWYFFFAGGYHFSFLPENDVPTAHLVKVERVLFLSANETRVRAFPPTQSGNTPSTCLRRHEIAAKPFVQPFLPPSWFYPPSLYPISSRRPPSSPSLLFATPLLFYSPPTSLLRRVRRRERRGRAFLGAVEGNEGRGVSFPARLPRRPSLGISGFPLGLGGKRTVARGVPSWLS